MKRDDVLDWIDSFWPWLPAELYDLADESGTATPAESLTATAEALRLFEDLPNELEGVSLLPFRDLLAEFLAFHGRHRSEYLHGPTIHDLMTIGGQAISARDRLLANGWFRFSKQVARESILMLAKNRSIPLPATSAKRFEDELIESGMARSVPDNSHSIELRTDYVLRLMPRFREHWSREAIRDEAKHLAKVTKSHQLEDS